MDSCNAFICIEVAAANPPSGPIIDSGLAILIGAIVALLGWVSAGRTARIGARRTHTYHVVEENQKNATLKECFATVKALVDVKIRPTRDRALEEFYPKFNFILDHYEYISAAIVCGDVDEKLMRQCERSRFIALAKIFDEYIRRTRIYKQQYGFCENLMAVAGRWERDRARSGHFHRLGEWYLMRPILHPPAPPTASARRSGSIFGKPDAWIKGIGASIARSRGRAAP